MKIGFHFSIRQGYLKALESANRMGYKTMQIFARHPRLWRQRRVSEDVFHEFRCRKNENKFGPLVIHSTYVPNLCSSNDSLYDKSIQSLIDELEISKKLSADFYILHPGAFSPLSSMSFGIKRFVAALKMVLKENIKIPILIENVAGGGRRVGSCFEELKEIFLKVDSSDQLGICFDTCHAFGAGYDLSTSQGIDHTISQFEKHIGLNKISVFHVNDSSGSLGSHLDLHEHIGRGHIGEKGLQEFLRKANLPQAVYILETPRHLQMLDRRNSNKISGIFNKKR